MTGNRLRLLPSALGLGKADILSSESALAPFSSFRKSFLKVFFLLDFELWFGAIFKPLFFERFTKVIRKKFSKRQNLVHFKRRFMTNLKVYFTFA